MGLDMYLTKETYVKNWDHMRSEERTHIAISGGRTKGIKPERISEIIEEVGYWRKANQIHAWFVRECQDGVDECQKTYVGREKLEKLLSACETVLADPKKAAELLPPQAGFFFGGTDVDEYYMEDLKRTVVIIKEALADEGDGSFYYRSSW